MSLNKCGHTKAAHVMIHQSKDPKLLYELYEPSWSEENRIRKSSDHSSDSSLTSLSDETYYAHLDNLIKTMENEFISKEMKQNSPSQSQLSQSFSPQIQHKRCMATLCIFPPLSTAQAQDASSTKPARNASKPILNASNIVHAIGDKFKFIKELGNGASCRVILCSDRNTNELYALKQLPRKHRMSAVLFDRECRLLLKLKQCACANIMEFVDCYMDDECYYVVSKYYGGQTLLDWITSLPIRYVNETLAANLVRCMLCAVCVMHGQNIVHRDLKLNNMVFETTLNLKDEFQASNLKLIDFGDSRMVENGATYGTCVGTLNYVAPEMLKPQKKGWELKKCDMWSIGVIAFILVTGTLPFSADKKQDTLQQIKSGTFAYPEHCILSAQCKDFIAQLLCLNTLKRMSCTDALRHEWITMNCRNPMEND